MIPIRLLIATFNLWNTERWPLRAPALKLFMERFCPDILCVQELRAETQTYLDEISPAHRRVHDSFVGWTCEGNIYWNGVLLEELDHGAEDVGILEEHRRLFWVRLRCLQQAATILVGTAHFTWRGNANERVTGLSPRIMQAKRVVEALGNLAQDGEPVFFAGDLNDSYHPVNVLQEAGYTNCFTGLAIPSQPTSPCYPTAAIPIDGLASCQTLDWILCNTRARPILAQVPHVYVGDVAASDHWPVLAFFELRTFP